ncbi:MAG TPA: glutamyl-tRNA reductase [Pseudomonadales bacterium]|nr:glutamyl-tRNA reductase [Pseudomonadales bacterium]
MALVALGINHKSASIDIREKVAFVPEQMEAALKDGCRQLGVEEMVILSTCNRTEVFFDADSEQPPAIHQWLANFHGVDAQALAQCTYVYQQEAAVHHVMKVASGLDSMVLGEPQILGQMKSAVAVAREAGTVKGQLHRLFDHVFAVAKQVRTDTAIGENPVSVAYASVDLSKQIFADLSKTSALLIGAGETIELVARHLRENGVSNLVIANRTLGRARDLADRFGAEAVMLSDIPERLEAADIVISSTASQLPILGKGAVERALKQRRHRPIFMVDIAVPRDIEQEVGDLDDVYLYTVDDLRSIVDSNIKNRQQEANKADDIIHLGVERYFNALRSLDAVDTIRAFRLKAEATRDVELDRALKQLQAGVEPEHVLAQLARGLTNKLIHAPTTQLKRAGESGRLDLLALSRQLFELDAGEDSE